MRWCIRIDGLCELFLLLFLLGVTACSRLQSLASGSFAEVLAGRSMQENVEKSFLGCAVRGATDGDLSTNVGWKIMQRSTGYVYF